MKPENRLLFGPLAAALLAVGIAVLPFWVPGYSQVHQTVSEIGEMDSPARISFTVMLCGVALCLAVRGVVRPVRRHRRALDSAPAHQPREPTLLA
jgi:hypothetical protein